MANTMKDVDKALREDEKRDKTLAKEVSNALNSRDYEEKCAEQNSCEARYHEDEKDEDDAVKKVFRAEDKAMNESEHHGCGCHKN